MKWFMVLFLSLLDVSQANVAINLSKVEQMLEEKKFNQEKIQIIKVNQYDFIIKFNDQTLIDEHDVLQVSFVNLDIESKESSSFIFKIESGGVACPAKYLIVDLKNIDKPFISKHFGNCSDTPKITNSSEELIFLFPEFKARPMLQYRYSNEKFYLEQ